MERVSTLERVIRTVLIVLVLVFFLFPIFWILLMSFQSNDQILRIPPSVFFEPTLANYTKILLRPLEVQFSKNWKPEDDSVLYSMNKPDREKIKQELAEAFADVFKQVDFLNNPGGDDVFGFDDMTVGSLQQVLPLPTAAWLGFAGLAGAAVIRRRAVR